MTTPLLNRSIRTATLLLAASAATLTPVATPAAAQQFESGNFDSGTFAIPSVTADDWRLDVDYRLPRPVFSGDRWYWYMPYTVTNKTDQDRLFIPEVTVVTSSGEIIPAGSRIPESVYQDVADLMENPLLVSPQDIIGDLRQGADFAKDGVIIWPHPVGDMHRMDIFFAGLSGETQPLLSPSTGEPILRLISEGRPTTALIDQARETR